MTRGAPSLTRSGASHQGKTALKPKDLHEGGCPAARGGSKAWGGTMGRLALSPCLDAARADAEPTSKGPAKRAQM